MTGRPGSSSYLRPYILRPHDTTALWPRWLYLDGVASEGFRAAAATATRRGVEINAVEVPQVGRGGSGQGVGLFKEATPAKLLRFQSGVAFFLCL